MGFFAIVHAAEQPFDVRACHINLWALQGFLRRVWYFDVGLHVSATTIDLAKIEVALPFGTEPKLRDLSEVLLDPKISPLIFGSPVSVDGRKLSFEDKCLNVVAVSENKEQSSIVDSRSDKDYTYWSLGLSPPVKMGSDAYFRIRFEITNPARLWINKARNGGALVDLRVADVRESVSVYSWKDLHSRLCPIPVLNAFVIASASLQQRASSPPLQYVRSLEGAVWQQYLHRKTSVWAQEKHLIYYWKYKSNAESVENSDLVGCAPIDVDQPFRGFLDLSRDRVPPSGCVPVVMTVIIVLSIALRESLTHIVEVAGKMIEPWWSSKLSRTISLAAVIPGLAWLASRIKWLREKAPMIRKVLRWVDDRLYSSK